MDDCVFCKIVSGRVPSIKVFENSDYLAFLDIAPRTLGHTLLVPKSHHRWIYDVPDFSEYWQMALKITRAMKKALSPKSVAFMAFGAEVPHAHISIIPMYDLSEDVSVRQKYEDELMKTTAKKIVSALS